MNRYKNEQGAALVLTLFIVTLILLFVLAQFYQVTNTRQQVNTMEKNINAEHMAEMGIDYFRQTIKMHDQEQTLEFVGSLPEALEIVDDFSAEGNRSFKIKQISVVEKDNPKEIIINFTSTGKAFEKEVSKNSKITITIDEN